MKRPPKKRNLDIGRLRLDFDCDPEAGVLIWTHNVARGHVYRGKVAGRVGNRGYVCIKYLGKDWLAHVLIWAHIHGEVPTLEIDHINRDRADNRLANLRLVTRAENAANRNVEKVADAPTGIYFSARERKWKVGLRVAGKKQHIGTFATLEQASAALEKAGVTP